MPLTTGNGTVNQTGSRLRWTQKRLGLKIFTANGPGWDGLRISAMQRSNDYWSNLVASAGPASSLKNEVPVVT